MISSKQCFKCGSILPLTEFYKHPAMGDGHLGKCKECTKKDVSGHRAANIEKVRAYDRARALLPDRKKTAAEISARWRKEDARRGAAHYKVCRAVANGDIERMPCVVCGALKAYAHHESYDRPLDVVWYCQPHHKERHKQMAIEGIEP